MFGYLLMFLGVLFLSSAYGAEKPEWLKGLNTNLEEKAFHAKVDAIYFGRSKIKETFRKTFLRLSQRLETEPTALEVLVVEGGVGTGKLLLASRVVKAVNATPVEDALGPYKYSPSDYAQVVGFEREILTPEFKNKINLKAPITLYYLDDLGLDDDSLVEVLAHIDSIRKKKMEELFSMNINPGLFKRGILVVVDPKEKAKEYLRNNFQLSENGILQFDTFTDEEMIKWVQLSVDRRIDFHVDERVVKIEQSDSFRAYLQIGPWTLKKGDEQKNGLAVIEFWMDNNLNPILMRVRRELMDEERFGPDVTFTLYLGYDFSKKRVTLSLDDE